MCDCISSNCPELGGKTPQLNVIVPKGLADSGCVIGVDPCIAPAIAILWGAKISTHSNCCGHNGIFPRHFVVDCQFAETARRLLDGAGYDDITISYWINGKRHDDRPFDTTKLDRIKAERKDAPCHIDKKPPGA